MKHSKFALMLPLILIISGLMFGVSACKKEKKKPEIVVQTKVVTNIWTSLAQAGGTVSCGEINDVYEMGLYWDTLNAPEGVQFQWIVQDGSYDFSHLITDLKPHTTYMVRAYAKAENSTYFGNIVTFTTKENSDFVPPCNPDSNAMNWAGYNLGFYYAHYSTTGVNLGAYGFTASGSNCDIEIAFSSPPVTGKYVTGGNVSQFGLTQCVVSGVWFNDYNFSAAGDTIYVIKYGEGMYSATFCDLHFTPDGYPSAISTSGNLKTF
jgi:hypothetical protein